MVKSRIVIGTRGSLLALTQANWVADQIRSIFPEIKVDVQTIKTTGDKILDVALAKIGDRGLFVKEIENALLNGDVDIAVHSMKDLPTNLPNGLIIGAVPTREDPHDVLIMKNHAEAQLDLPLPMLNYGAKVGSSSLRRRAQLLHARPDIQIYDVRGNLDTRLRKLEEQFDAIILAAAGLKRLGWEDKISAEIPFKVSLPAVGQGALAIEVRENDQDTLDAIKFIDDPISHACVISERSLMCRLEGGCQVPIGAVCLWRDPEIELHAMVASLDGSELIRDYLSGELESAQDLGVSLAETLLARGGLEILKVIREEYP